MQNVRSFQAYLDDRAARRYRKEQSRSVAAIESGHGSPQMPRHLHHHR